MTENRIMNAGVGALLLLAAVSTLFLAFYASTPDWKEYQGYSLHANFDEAAGLRARAPIRIAGVQVGEVWECCGQVLGSIIANAIVPVRHRRETRTHTGTQRERERAHHITPRGEGAGGPRRGRREAA